MKFNIIILLFFTSCVNYSTSVHQKQPYSSKGFANILYDSEKIYKDQPEFFVSHNQLWRGTKIRITNPENNEFIDIQINRKSTYDNFYKILISESVAKKIKLNEDLPYVEINEIKKNKSFIAKKGITQLEERKIANKAPVEKISINNISNIEKKIISKKRQFSVIIADFYSKESAKNLMIKLQSNQNLNEKLIHIREKNKKNYELLMGPYSTIKSLKNDYIALNVSGFEELDIKINE